MGPLTHSVSPDITWSLRPSDRCGSLLALTGQLADAERPVADTGSPLVVTGNPVIDRGGSRVVMGGKSADTADPLADTRLRLTEMDAKWPSQMVLLPTQVAHGPLCWVSGGLLADTGESFRSNTITFVTRNQFRTQTISC